MPDINVGDRVRKTPGREGTVWAVRGVSVWVLFDGDATATTHHVSSLTIIPNTVTKEIPVEVWERFYEAGTSGAVEVSVAGLMADVRKIVEANQEAVDRP